jgi:hypothetical protein
MAAGEIDPLPRGSNVRAMAGDDTNRSFRRDPQRGAETMKKPGTRYAAIVAGAAALIATLGACAADETSTARAPSAARAQHVTVSAREYKLDVRGVRALRPGFVRVTIRNDGRGEHGVELIGLRRKFSTPELLTAFENEDVRGLEALGGTVSVPPGQRWEMTVRLGAGNYALLDYGENGGKANFERGMVKRFRVAGPPRTGEAKPRTVGTLAMQDFAFEMRLPRPFYGRGTVAIPNRGRALHEVSLVRIQPGHTQGEVLRLIKQGEGSPPPWASIHELLGVLGPKRTAYVRVDLAPGRYVALCLIHEPKGRLHADLGMIGTFDVVKAGK